MLYIYNNFQCPCFKNNTKIFFKKQQYKYMRAEKSYFGTDFGKISKYDANKIIFKIWNYFLTILQLKNVFNEIYSGKKKLTFFWQLSVTCKTAFLF